MAGLRWRLSYDGHEYTFDAERDITVSGLRKIKEWYGPELGRNLSFQNALLQQDPEAVLCAVWLARRAAGEANIPEPNQMDDAPMNDLIQFIQPGDVEDENPTGGEEQTPDSTETPTSSEPQTSDSSQPSAISTPET